MSKNQMANGQTDDQVNDEIKDQEIITEVKSPDAVLKKNRELLAKLKERSEAEQKLRDQIDIFEQEKLAQAGKKDELIDSLRKQIKDTQEKIKGMTQTFALKSVNQQVLEAAREMGSTKPEHVMKFADLSTVTVNEDFSVDNDALKLALEKVREELPELFKKAPAAPRDGTPNARVDGQKSIDKMSIVELQQLYMKKALEQN